MRYTFLIPRRFNPAYSLLGRWMRHLVSDERRAEAYFIILLCGFALALLLTQYLAWALLQPIEFAESPGSVATLFWLFQLGSFIGCGLTCVLGFKPAITLACHPDALHLKQGRSSTSLPYGEIQGIEIISAQRYHRHYRRYAATRCFVNRIEPSLLLVHTDGGPLVIGLAADDQAVLEAYLQAKRLPAYAASAA